MLRIDRYIRLQLKAIQRDNESLFFVTTLIAILVGIGGYYWGALTNAPYGYNLSFIITCYGLLFSDYILKLLYKQNFTFPNLVKCMPESDRLYIPCYWVKETTSIWNLYLPVFLLFPIFRAMYPLYGFIVAVMLLTGIFLLTLLVSNVVIFLNMGKNKLLYSILFFPFLSLILFLFYASFLSYKEWLLGLVTIFLAGLNVIFVAGNVRLMKYSSVQDTKRRFWIIPFFKHSSFFLYTSLHIRMVLRSSMLRYQLIVFVFLACFYLFSIITKPSLMDDFVTRFFLFSIILLMYPSACIVRIFSAEGSFFDHLVLSPSFPSFLKSRYRENIFYISVLFIITLLALKDYTELYYGLFAMYFYFAGVVIPLEYLNIFSANTKIDLSSYAKALASQSRRWPSLYMLGIVIAELGIVFLIYFLFSVEAANHFMFFSGLIFGLFSHRWLAIIHQYYMKHTRYKHMENYRK